MLPHSQQFMAACCPKDLREERGAVVCGEEREVNPWYWVPGVSEHSQARFHVKLRAVEVSGFLNWMRCPGRQPAHLSRRASSSWHVQGTCRQGMRLSA
jgi:hypothetical protein